MPSRTSAIKKPSPSTNSASRRIAPNPITERKRAAKNGKALKQIFKGKCISSLGQFENCGKFLGPVEIANYVQNHGGVYEKEISPRTTHLICTIEDYMKKHPQVQRAWALGKGRCSIVVFDWLLDCTVSNKKSCRAAGGYTLDRTIKRIQQGKCDLQTYREKFNEGVRASKEMVNNKLWHIYYDSTAFEYKVILTRINLGAHSDKPMVEKYTLYLFESHAKPHLYMVAAKLSRSHRPCAYYREHVRAMEFHDAFKHFQHFFKDKTGLDWDMRLEKLVRPVLPPIIKPKGKKAAQAQAEAQVQVPVPVPDRVERKFTWTPPVCGRPVGLLPYGYVRPEDREDAIKKHESESGSGSGSGSGTESGFGSASGSGEDTNGSEEGSSSSDESGGSGSGSGSSEDEQKSSQSEDVVYDTDSDVDSDDEVDELPMRPSGINFGADLALARAMVMKPQLDIIEIMSD